MGKIIIPSYHNQYKKNNEAIKQWTSPSPLLLEAQDMLIEVLTERFGSVSGELSEQIKHIDSRERLKNMLRQALRVKSFEEFGKKVVSN